LAILPKTPLPANLVSPTVWLQGVGFSFFKEDTYMDTMPAGYIAPSNNLFQFLDTNGDESGTTNAIGDYSTPDDFFIKPAAGELFEVSRLIVNIASDSVLAAGKYGSLDALTTGLNVYVDDGNGEILLTKLPIKTHEDWAALCHDSVALNYGNVAGKAISVRWSFFKSGSGLWLSGNNDNKLIVRLSDDMTGLTRHTFYANGIKHNIS
jgi:hypothetical protein